MTASAVEVGKVLASAAGATVVMGVPRPARMGPSRESPPMP
ncbi:hypothetical protein ABT294_07335 [Nonomuraea sp. NPDC000554]